MPSSYFVVSPIVDSSCASCSQRLGFSLRKLKLIFNLSKAPRGTPPEVVACPCCDRIWEDIHIQALRLDPMAGHGGGGQQGHGQGQGQGHGQGQGNGQGHGNGQGQGYGQGQGQGQGNGNGQGNGQGNGYGQGQGHGQGQGYGNGNGQGRGQVNDNYQQNNQQNAGGRALHQPETSDYSAAATGVNIKKASRATKENSGGSGDVRAFFNNTSQDENAPNCVCGGRAVTKTTVKEGPNKGRKFYTCPKPR